MLKHFPIKNFIMPPPQKASRAPPPHFQSRSPVNILP